jgi:hypothetical protein
MAGGTGTQVTPQPQLQSTGQKANSPRFQSLANLNLQASGQQAAVMPAGVKPNAAQQIQSSANMTPYADPYSSTPMSDMQRQRMMSAMSSSTGIQPLQAVDALNASQSAPQAIASGVKLAGLGAAREMDYQPLDVQAAMASSQGYDISKAGSQGYDAERIAGVSPITAQQVQAGQLAGTSLSPYFNPYESQVVQQSLTDLERQRQIQQNLGGAQAQAAGAFGGSRQGIAEAETNRAFAEQAARTAAGLRQAGFTQAQQAAQQDIATRMQAALANQGANLQAATTTGQFGMQQQLANQAAFNQAAQFGAQAANVAALQNAAAQTQANQFGAQSANQAALANQQAMMAAQQANQQAGLQGSAQRLGASSQLGQTANLGFGMVNTINQQVAQQGLQEQAMQQALIDAAKGQYAGYTGAPQQALQTSLGAFGGSQTGAQTQTSTKQPGLFDYLTLGASMF